MQCRGGSGPCSLRPTDKKITPAWLGGKRWWGEGYDTMVGGLIVRMAAMGTEVYTW